MEGDSVNPLSVYAETKSRGGNVVARHSRALIVRTSLNGAPPLRATAASTRNCAAPGRPGAP